MYTEKSKIVIIRFDERIPLTLPSKSKEKAEKIIKDLKNDENLTKLEIKVNPEDYFFTKYLYYLGRLENIKVIYKDINPLTGEYELYEDFYQIPSLERVMKVFRDLYLLDFNSI